MGIRFGVITGAPMKGRRIEMTDYDFSQLNDKEFEVLATDLLSLLLNKRIERFKPGRDQGVDGRFFSLDGSEIVLQYKHYVRTGYNGLLAKLKSEELPKVRTISPIRYYLVTSVPLSRKNKSDIKTLFAPFIKSDNDIFGQEDLNDLLAQNPHIEEKHYKLWITSANVMQRIMNHAIKGRSQYEIERFQKNSHRYVETSYHELALRILRENRVIIITGEPGVGKTTLAENLCLYFASLGYEFIDIEESVSEAENVYMPNKQQIFYFDDFLGSNYFEAIENKKDAHIMKFIDRVRNDGNKLFILTSRTNIFNNGIQYSPYFMNQKIERNEFLLTIGALSDMDKARILYNHLWHSKLGNDFIEEIYKDRRYFVIIEHKNFNPRLIEFITDNDRLQIDPLNYWEHILTTLNNPQGIWSECFKNQNNAFVRNMVLLTVFNGGSIMEDDLRNGYYQLCELSGLVNPSHTEKDFESMSRIATKSFLNRNMYPDKIQFELFNPSIADFVLNNYCKDIDKLVQIYRSLDTCKSLERLISLENEGILSELTVLRIKEAVFYHAFNEMKPIDYMIFLSRLFMKDQHKRSQIGFFLQQIIDDPQPICELERFFELLREFSVELKVNGWKFIEACIDHKELNEYEIDQFARLLEHSDCSDEALLEILRNNIRKYLSFEIDYLKEEINLLGPITYREDVGEYEIAVDLTYMKDKVSSIVNDLLENFQSGLVKRLKPTVDEMIEAIDINQLVENYNRHRKMFSETDFGGRAGCTGNDIEDLFEKT